MNENPIFVENEINILLKLHYCSFLPKSLPKFYGFHRENGKYYIFLDFYERNLRQYINERELNFVTIKKFFFQLIKAFAFLQSLRIAHRDIKPDNIMITREEDVVIVDFDMAEIYLNNNDEIRTSWRGSEGYKSPEWIKVDLERAIDLERSIDLDINLFKADAYSLGLVVLEMGKVFKKNENTNYEDLNGFENEVTERKQKWFSDFKNKYRDINDTEKKLVFSLLRHCLNIQINERKDFIGLFSQYIKSKYKKVSQQSNALKARFKYHIIINDYQNLEFFSDIEKRQIENLNFYSEGNRNEIVILANVSSIMYIETADPCCFNPIVIVNLILIFISLIITFLFVIISSIYESNRAIIALTSLIMAFDLFRFITTSLFFASYCRKYFNLLAKYKKQLIFIYSMTYILRNSLNLCFLPLNYVENVRPFWNFSIFYLIIQILELFSFLYIMFSKIRVSRMGNKKVICFLAIGCGIFCFLSLISFLTKIIIIDEINKNNELNVVIALIFLIDLFKTIFWAFTFFLIIFQRKVVNQIVIGSFPIIFIFISVGRLINGGIFLRETEPLEKFQYSMNFEIFFLIAFPLFEFGLIIFYKKKCPNFIYEFKNWTSSQIKIFVAVVTFKIFLVLISLGTLLNFSNKSTQEMRSAYIILSFLVVLDFILITLIITITIFYCKAKKIVSQERLKSNLMKYFMYCIYGTILFWGIRILLGIVALTFIQSDLDYLSEISDSHEKIESYEALVSLKSFHDYEIFFIIFSFFFNLIVFIKRNTILRSIRV